MGAIAYNFVKEFPSSDKLQNNKNICLAAHYLNHKDSDKIKETAHKTKICSVLL